MEPCARSALPVRAALLCAVTLLASPHHNSEAQVVSVKTLRSSNFRRDELYRKEETIIVSGSGHIQSPRYPSSYPRNLLLSWKLLCPPSSRILLDFDVHFGLEEAENDVCRYDFVEVEDISETSTIIWGRWCGQKAPSRITSKTNTLKVTFKSDNYFVAKPGFKLCYSLLGPSMFAPAETEVPMNAAALDQAISAFSTVEEMLRHLNPESWQEDMDSLYSDTTQYRPRVYHQYDRKSKIDLDRLYEDVKRYSCTPRNYSVNLREELRATNAVFFPRCLLVQRCGGNCACGTDNWNSCTCGPGKIISKLHEVLKFSPGPGYYKSRTRARWVLEEIYLQHHERCDCMCHSRPPR